MFYPTHCPVCNCTLEYREIGFSHNPIDKAISTINLSCYPLCKYSIKISINGWVEESRCVEGFFIFNLMARTWTGAQEYKFGIGRDGKRFYVKEKLNINMSLDKIKRLWLYNNVLSE